MWSLNCITKNNSVEKISLIPQWDFFFQLFKYKVKIHVYRIGSSLQKKEIISIKRAFHFISHLIEKNHCCVIVAEFARSLPFYFHFSANKKEVLAQNMGGLVHYLFLSFYCFLPTHKKIRSSVKLRLLSETCC